MSGACVHFDCTAGAGGDMLLAALLDAGCPLDPVRDAVRACTAAEVRLGVRETRRAGLRGLLLTVETGAAPHRTLGDHLEAVETAGLPPRARAWAVTALRRLGRCEARLHGVPEDEVELHELGAVDTLVDVVGVCTALDLVDAGRVLCSPLPAATGTVRTDHGTLPLPAPATLALLAEVGAPLVPGVAGVEQVTPTAAALLSTVARFEAPAMRLRAVGHGAGTRDDPRRPNLVRCWVGDDLAPAGGGAAPAFDDPCVELRTNLDDAAPAVVAELASRALGAGALDAWVVAATMKKGRPGHVLHALVPAGAEAAVAALLLAEGPTLGIRGTAAPRMVAGRDVRAFVSPLGEVRVKRKLLAGRVVDARPELDDCRRLAAATGRPLHQVIDTVSAAARDALLGEAAGR